MIKKIRDYLSESRWLCVLILGIIEFLVLYYFQDEWKEFFQPINNDKNTWLGPFFTLLVASPTAYVIWIFRNSDKKRDQQQAEENIRQLDFHKIEEWATTVTLTSNIN